jgi:uncharacterized sulfatase
LRKRPGLKRREPYEGWLKASEGNPEQHKHAMLYRIRPEFELYNINNDPFELNNLLESSEDYVQIKNELFEELNTWMDDQQDKGLETEWKALTRFKGDSLKWKAYRSGLMDFTKIDS